MLRNVGLVRTRPDGDSDGHWEQIRTDLIVWSLLPEDLDGLTGRASDGSDYAAYADWQ